MYWLILMWERTYGVMLLRIEVSQRDWTFKRMKVKRKTKTFIKLFIFFMSFVLVSGFVIAFSGFDY